MIDQSCYPITRPIRTTEPTAEQEPISLDEARSQCGLVGNNAHDADLQGFITSAREQVENDTGLVCYTGSFTWKLTDWPYESWFEIRALRPVTAITSITYLDGSGATQTWAASSYQLETSTVVPLVRLTYAQSWPGDFRGDVNGITVTLVAGYASVEAVPQRVKQAVRLAVHVLWLLKMEDAAEAQKQQVAYDRQIWLLQRGSYP